MRLFVKIFFFGTLIFSMAFLPAGYYLISYSYENAIQRETVLALNQYQYDKFTVQAELLTNAVNFQNGRLTDNPVSGSLADRLSGQAVVLSGNKELLYTSLQIEIDYSIIDNVLEDLVIYRLQKVKGRSYILVCGKIVQSDVTLYLMTVSDISMTVVQQELMMRHFQRVYAATLCFSMVLILLLSSLLTRPIKRMTRAARRIAGGSYSDRLSVSGSDEIGELAQSFNLMAEAIEDKMYQLSENARQKEDFVASFAHELKTPLTSVIGYADTLYQKDLSPENRKKAAWYILSEGMRLEALSLKLMDLVVLNRQDFILEEMPAHELLEGVVQGLAPVLEEKNIKAYLEAETAFIKVEYDLFKTLLLNIMDNSIKAGSSEIRISGKCKDNLYSIRIADNGRGIPESEIERITEAFYTVDKSRSRKQHGAGLGLTLADKIAKIHGSRLEFSSEHGAGTAVQIQLICKGGGDNA